MEKNSYTEFQEVTLTKALWLMRISNMNDRLKTCDYWACWKEPDAFWCRIIWNLSLNSKIDCFLSKEANLDYRTVLKIKYFNNIVLQINNFRKSKTIEKYFGEIKLASK